MAKLPERGKSFHVSFRISRHHSPGAYRALWQLIDASPAKVTPDEINWREFFTSMIGSGDIEFSDIREDEPITRDILASALLQQERAMETMLSEFGNVLIDKIMSDVRAGVLSPTDGIAMIEQQSEKDSEAQRKAKERLKQYQNRYNNK